MKIDAWQMARKVGSVKKPNLHQSDEKCHLPLETVSVELVASLGLLYLSLNVCIFLLSFLLVKLLLYFMGWKPVFSPTKNRTIVVFTVAHRKRSKTSTGVG